jgi:Bacterial Ig-like domain/Domain of unknown function (DUF5122) beta-propeller
LLRRKLSVLMATGLMLTLLAASPVLAEVSDEPDNAPQTDGIVFSVLPVGNRIYIGGEFTHVDGVPRDRLAAINATTGELTDWNPGANKKVFALASSPDGTRIYAGGAFSTVGGITRNSVVALDATTGAVDAGFNAGRLDATVRAVAVLGERLYLGGDFTTVQGQSRTRLALVNGTTGALDPNWAPAASDIVRALVASPDGNRIYAGGRFTSISGESRLRLAALDPASNGAPLSWRTLVNPNGPIIDLAVSGGQVYAAAGGVAGAAESYDAGTGARAWQLKGDGDFQAITVTGGKAYIGGHFLKLGGQERRFFAAADALTGALDSQWTPSGSGVKLSEPTSTGVWDLQPDESRGRLYAGTNFSKVNGQPHAGFVQFSSLDDLTTPTVESVSPADGTQDVRLTASVEATFSEAMDATTLDETTFTLTKEGDSTPVPAMVSYDAANNKATLAPSSYLEASQTYTARITTGATDTAGNPLANERVWSFTTTASTDIMAPTVDSPKENFIANSPLGSSGIRVELVWSATDDDSGVVSYELQRSTNGGAYQDVRLSAPTATSTKLSLSPGSTYQFRVRATDDADNTSEWTSGALFTVEDHQETSEAIAYAGSWTDQTLSTAYGGSLKFAEGVGGESAIFSFTGSEVAWIAPKGPDRGKAEVWVDGIKVKTVDLYSSSEKPGIVVFTQSVGLGSHTVEVRALGIKNSSSSGKGVDVDAFFALH